MNKHFHTDDAFDLQREQRANSIVPSICTTITLNSSRYFYKPEKPEPVKKRHGEMSLTELNAYFDKRFGRGKWKRSGRYVECLDSEGHWQDDYYEIGKRGDWYFIVDPNWT